MALLGHMRFISVDGHVIGHRGHRFGDGQTGSPSGTQRNCSASLRVRIGLLDVAGSTGHGASWVAETDLPQVGGKDPPDHDEAYWLYGYDPATNFDLPPCKSQGQTRPPRVLAGSVQARRRKSSSTVRVVHVTVRRRTRSRQRARMTASESQPSISLFDVRLGLVR